jgi:hypothetical protein
MHLGRTVLLACALTVIACGAARADAPDHVVYDGTSQGWNGAGTVCDFRLYSESSSTTNAVVFHHRRPGQTQGIFHIHEQGLFRNERTGAVLMYEAQWTESGAAKVFRLRGGFLRLRDGDGRLAWSSAGAVRIADVHDMYVFLSQTPHAEVVPGFGAVPTEAFCSLLGGHAA